MTEFAGVHVATTTPFADDTLEVDLDRFRAHCSWLFDEGISGLFPTGSLGEYESMTPEERRAVIRAAVEVADGRGKVIPGMSGPSAHLLAEQAAQAKADGVDGLMVLPPTNHPATLDELIAHFTAVAEVGLPVIAYNNPFSTKHDLTPDVLARLARIDGVVGVKEFSGDVRRISAILELAPGLEVICGADDVAFEAALMGATGWIGGFTGVFPRSCVAMFEAGVKGEVEPARSNYRAMLPALRWDTTPAFVQAIKLAIDVVGQPGGGVVRPPRLPLPEADRIQVEKDVRAALEVDA
jgi:1-pyrroline-4-hydroxy-2-carboxylate deaminase